MRRNANYKVLIVSITLALFFLIIGANVFVVSVFGYHIDSKTNMKNQLGDIRQVENKLVANRGSIADRNGTVLAQDVAAYTLFANIDPDTVNAGSRPAYVVDKETAAQQLASVLNLSYEEILEILSRDAKQVEFGSSGKYLTLDQKNQIIEFDIPGIGFTNIISRNYPLEPFAPNILGFSRFNEQTAIQEGQLGIELLYNKELTGSDGTESYQQDADGYILYPSESFKVEAQNGSNIKLTLDRGIQETLENAMAGMSSDVNVKAKEVWGAVVEIKTGKILGWAEYPFFDANDPNTNWNSRGVQYTYEPGSTMKTFTVASAIEQGVYNGADTFYSGPFYVGVSDGKTVRLQGESGSIHTITNAKNINYGTITYDYGYAVSSNVMIAEMMSGQMNIEKFHDDLIELGFFNSINMDRIADESGYDLWTGPLEKLTNGFGQGSTITMLQMVQAYTSILGNGTVVKPYLVDEITNPNTGELMYKGQVTYGNKVYKESTAASVRDNMREVVASGSARRFDIDEVTMIGKTGTAQYVAPDKPGYSNTEYIFSSILAFPYEDPEVMVYTAYRANMGHELDDQAKYLKDVLRKVVNTYEFDESNDSGFIDQSQVGTVRNFVNIGVDEAYESLKSSGYRPLIIGDGSSVISQYPKGNSKLITDELVLLYSSKNGIIMPDMNGWSLKEVQNFASITGLSMNISGSGFVKSQSLASGSAVDFESEISIQLD